VCTHTHKHVHMHRQTYTHDITSHIDGHRHGAASSSTHGGDSYQTQAQTATSPPPLGLAEDESHWCITHTTLSRFISTCAFMSPLPSWHPCLDPSPPYPPHGSLTHQLIQLGARCTHTALTHSSHRHPTLVHPLKYQRGPSTRLMPLPRPGASCSPAGLDWSLPVNPHAHPMHAWLGKVQTLAPSSWHPAHRLDPWS